MSHKHRRQQPRQARREVSTAELIGELSAGFTTEQIAEAMELAGVDPDKIYAFRRTGMMPTEATVDLFTAEQLGEWDAAIAEFEEQASLATKGATA